MATSNKTLPIAIVAGLVGIGVVYFGMNFPAGDEVVGTVAPAERYRAEQPDAADVVLGDQAIQELKAG